MSQQRANPNNLEALWMPFTSNRHFKAAPRMVTKAEGMYYTRADGEKVMDTVAGMWCCNAGHSRPRIVQAIQKQAAELDYAPAFSFGYAPAFEYASRLATLSPGKLNHVFFANSGSEGVDTALKMALAYWRYKGEGTKTRFIGRVRAYHGVGFGGISVGGIAFNRKMYHTQMLPGVDHLPQTYSYEHQKFTIGEPEWGAHLADDLERLINQNDPSTVAAVIVEPMQGSGGVVPPPKGYLQRLREISKKYSVLLIFDEVITGFGRLGHLWAAERYAIEPDMIVFAKGVTSGAVPLGGVLASAEIYEAFMQGPQHVSEFPHGYTYSAHPLAIAAANAALDVYLEEGLFQRAKDLEQFWGEAAMTLKNANHVIDIRTLGLTAGIEMRSREGKVGERGLEVLDRAFNEQKLMVRVTGDTIALTPPLIISKQEIEDIFGRLGKLLAGVA